MSATEALRTQLDTLRLEMQQLQVENARLRDDHPEEAALIDAIAMQDQLKEERDNQAAEILRLKADSQRERENLQAQKERLTAEVMQLKALNDQLLEEARKEQRVLADLQSREERLKAECDEMLAAKEKDLERELAAKDEEMEKELSLFQEAAELERYRALEKERQKWEEREQRLLQQLDELQERQAAESRVSIGSAVGLEATTEGSARTRRVTFAASSACDVAVSDSYMSGSHMSGMSRVTPTEVSCTSSLVTESGLSLVTTTEPEVTYRSATRLPSSSIGYAGSAWSPSWGRPSSMGHGSPSLGGSLMSTGIWGSLGGVAESGLGFNGMSGGEGVSSDSSRVTGGDARCDSTRGTGGGDFTRVTGEGVLGDSTRVTGGGVCGDSSRGTGGGDFTRVTGGGVCGDSSRGTGGGVSGDFTRGTGGGVSGDFTRGTGEGVICDSTRGTGRGVLSDSTGDTGGRTCVLGGVTGAGEAVVGTAGASSGLGSSMVVGSGRVAGTDRGGVTVTRAGVRHVTETRSATAGGGSTNHRGAGSTSAVCSTRSDTVTGSSRVLASSDGAGDGLARGCSADSGDRQSHKGEGALAAAYMSAAFMSQLPPLPKFSGTADPEKESVKEWLEQFELVASVCRWDGPTKLVNLITRLKGEAYSFYLSCSSQQRNSFEELAAALVRRFTPVRLQAVQTSKFHERKQKSNESVDGYAQELRSLFLKAYPSAQRGSEEAESMGRAVLASQFTAGLLPEIKAKVAGAEGDFEALLVKARFEEAKLRDLRGAQQRNSWQPPRGSNKSFSSTPPEDLRHPKESSQNQDQRLADVRCYECGGKGHYRNRCPHKSRGGPAEASDRNKDKQVANLVPESPAAKEKPLEKDDDGVEEALERVTATTLTLSSEEASSVLGPVPKAEVELEGSSVHALLDTGSPVTIVSLDFLLEVLAKKRPQSQSLEDWKQEVGRKLEPTPVALRSYGGGKLPIVRQMDVVLSRPGYQVKAKIQVQKGAPAKLLIGTDLLSRLGFLFVKTEIEGEDVDLLEVPEPASEVKDTDQPVSTTSKQGDSKSGVVSWLRPVRLPGQHSKLVRARVQGLEQGQLQQSVSYFEPKLELNGNSILLSEAVTEVDKDNCVVMVMENHGHEPVEVDERQILGGVEEVRLCHDGEVEECVSAMVPSGDERLQRLKENVKLGSSDFMVEQTEQLEQLVLEFADVVSLDSTSDLVTHTVDTGDSPEESLVAAFEDPQQSPKSGEVGLGARQRGDNYKEIESLPKQPQKAKELALSRSQYLSVNTVLHYLEKDKTLRIIPPESDRKSLFKEVHGGVFSRHLRDVKIHGQLCIQYWWQGMRSDLIRWCQGCLVCASRQVGQAVCPLLTPIPVSGPFDFVGVDVLKFPKVYKFARPYHGPFRVMEVLDAGLIVRPITSSKEGDIRVALTRVRRCPDAIPAEAFWPRKRSAGVPHEENLHEEASSEREPSKKKSNPVPTASSAMRDGVWSGRLRRS